MSGTCMSWPRCHLLIQIHWTHSVSTLSIILTKRKRVNIFQKHLHLFAETLWNNLHFPEFTKSCCFQNWLPIRFPVPVQACQSRKIPLQDYSHYYALSLTSTIQIHFYICKKLLSKNTFLLSKTRLRQPKGTQKLIFLITEHNCHFFLLFMIAIHACILFLFNY